MTSSLITHGYIHECRFINSSMVHVLLILLVGIIFSTGLAAKSGHGEIIYRFTALDYDWPSNAEKLQAISNAEFIVGNNVITGLKVYRDDVFVTVPRWKPGVPATLNKVVSTGGNNILQPFPNWTMNAVGNCDALQYTQSMEVDPNTGYMWIIDTGRIDTNADQQLPRNLCPAKIVILDITTKTIVRTFTFPSSVVSPTSNFLNDIVLDYVHGKARYAYITDTRDAKLYVYDYERNSAYYFQHDSMKEQPLIPGTQDGLVSAPVDGIAMSYDFKYLYYSTLSSRLLYAVPTSVMRNKSADFASSLITVGRKHGGSDGMACGQSSLFYGALEDNAVYKANVGTGGIVSLSDQQQLVANDDTAVWVDTFAWNGTDLWFTANKLPQYFAGLMSFSGNDTNMAIWKLDVGENGYLFDAKARTQSSSAIIG